jgi:hypothetical protein
MKCSEFKALVEKISGLYVAAGARVQQEHLANISPIFDLMPTKSVADLAKRIAAVGKLAEDHDRATIGPAFRVLKAVEELFFDYGKPAATKDLAIFLASLEAHQNSAVAALIEAVAAPSPTKKKPRPEPLPIRNDLVSGYSRRFEQALGDDEGFKREYARLEGDEDIQPNEIIALARTFAKASAKSRGAALKKILSRHQSLMVSRAKAAATGGRVAG